MKKSNREQNRTTNRKEVLKRIAAAAVAAVVLAGAGVHSAYAADTTEGVIATPYVSIGADLAPDQRAVVLSLLGLTEESLAEYRVMEITNQQEHEYLDEYLPAEIIGDQAWSSAKILAREAGHGITVSTQNINYCTAAMYENALATAGVENAEIQVAGPVPISGTAALIGIMNAYADMNQEELSAENVDAATDELVTTSKLGELLGDKDKASELIAAVKEAIAENGIKKPEDADSLVEDAARQLNISLSQEEKDMILSLVDKISKLDLDVNKLKEQAKGIYNKLESMDIHLNREEVKGILGKVGYWFSQIWEKMIDLFDSFS
ncbi:MAG: DUF1002 domain-containing protein [Lachnospiraceae bacterium]|nr:DUF1002 domain-containing protein [Lachnospiraceae bacterium]